MIRTTLSSSMATVKDCLTFRQVTERNIKDTAAVKEYFITQAVLQDMAALEQMEDKMLQVKKDDLYLREACYAR